MAESLFVQKLNELIGSAAKAAAPDAAKAAQEVDNLGKTNAAPVAAIPPFPVPPNSAKLLKPEEIKYLNSVPVEKRPVVPMMGDKPNYDDKGFQTGYKTLLFDYRDAEAKKKKEAEMKALQSQAP